MPKLSVYDLSGAQTGEIELNDSVFGAEFNEAVVHQAVVMQLANQRQGTSATKTRAMVRGGGRKPWKQKGTGRARCGSNRSPVWVGGGTTFGPQPRSYAVGEGLAFDAPKTKQVASLLKAFEAVDTKALLITDGSNENVALSARNMPKVTTITNMGLNCFDILNSKKVFLAKDAVEKIEEVLA